MKYAIAGILLSMGLAAHAEEPARWIVIPATTAPVVSSGSPLLFAWRLDTKTGALAMCTYDPGGWANANKLPAPETLNCTAPNNP